MDKAETNRGYMTEALRCVIDFAFNRLRLHRIEANIMPRNHASRRVVEKLGFHYEGLARQYLQINGRWEDHAFCPDQMISAGGLKSRREE